jgi:hypothetical protein
MTVTLETLELTPEERNSCQDAVEQMAYFNWLGAGSPDDGQLEFWLEAEREWIGYNYVPNRPLDGARPQSGIQPATVAAGESREEPIPQNHAVALAHKRKLKTGH